jgi:hypothetical protein
MSIVSAISSNHALFACITASHMAVSLATIVLRFRTSNWGKWNDHRRKMQNTRYGVQSTRVID